MSILAKIKALLVPSHVADDGMFDLLPRVHLWPRPSAPERLTKEQFGHIATHSTCPYCGSRLLAGPMGGAMQNVYCSGVEKCDSFFNVGLAGFDYAEFMGETPYHVKAQLREDKSAHA